MRLGPVYEDGGKLWQDVVSHEGEPKPNVYQFRDSPDDAWIGADVNDRDQNWHRGFEYRIPALPAPVSSVASTDNPKDLIGITKPQLNLIPASAMILEAAVMQLGAAKYGPFNWRDRSVKASIYVAACLRHLLSWHDGQSTDEESGVSHLAHARACLGILLDAEACGKMVDDRPAAGQAAELIKQNTKVAK